MKKTNVICSSCQGEFLKLNKEINRCKKRGITSHFCSRSCVAKHRNKNMTSDYWKKQYQKHSTLKRFAGNRQSENSPFRTFINKGRASIKAKGCSLTTEYLKLQWEKQNGICPYTNIKMILPRNTLEYTKTKSLMKASLDRIDSSKGYIEGNVEFVCSAINLAKNNFSKEAMVSFLQETIASLNALSVTQVQPT
jgi:hypothetical protein